jgi:DNA replication initiation complex subunit (GINS family)
MSISSFTSASLKSLSKLIDKKESLIAEIAKIEAAVASLLTGKPVKAEGKRRGRPAKKSAAVKKSAPAKKAPKVVKKRVSGGGLGAKVLKALEAAGDAGVKVSALAKTLKIKGTNLHVWFATTGKKNPAIKKIGKGHYKLVK